VICWYWLEVQPQLLPTRLQATSLVLPCLSLLLTAVWSGNITKSPSQPIPIISPFLYLIHTALEMATSTFNLLGLPMELICHISSYLPTEDLGNLRLSCKSIEHMLFDLFATEFFETRQIFFHPISLLNLVEISKHPQFSNVVKKIILCDDLIARLDTSSQYETSQWLSQKHCIESGEGWRLLQEALGKFPNCRTLQQRDFVSGKKRRRDGTAWRSYGTRALMKDASARMTILPNQSLPSMYAFGIFQSVVAASQATFQLESLECINRSIPWNWCELYIPEYLDLEYKAAFSKLKILMLALPRPTDQSDRTIEGLKSFLSILPNLEHLRVNLIRGIDSQPLDRLVDILAEKPLQKLDLGKFELALPPLKRLLEAQKDHLQGLSLFRINLLRSSPQPWKEVLTLCKSLKRLKYVNFDTVFINNLDPVYYTDEGNDYHISWKIEAAVDGMDKLLDVVGDRLVSGSALRQAAHANAFESESEVSDDNEYDENDEDDNSDDDEDHDSNQDDSNGDDFRTSI
jgi:F-box domain